MALAALPADEAVQPLAQRLAHEEGLDRPAAGRQLADDGHVQIAVGDQRQRARDGRGGHDKQMRAAALLGELRPLGHAEAVLLVGHNEAEVAEHNGLTQKRVRADDQLRLAGGELFTCGALLHGSSGAGQQQHAHAERPEQLRERPRMLLGQNFRGCHEGGLPAVPDGAEARGSCDHRLAAADVALHEPVHHMAGGQILQDLVDRALLRAGQTEGQRGIKALHAVRRIRLGRQLRPGRAQDSQARGEDEKLLKDQPLACPLQRGPIGRLVDRRIGLGHAAKIIFPPHLLRQDLRQQLRRERERLLHALGHQAVGKSRRQRIDRQQTVRHGAGPVRRVVRGVRHLHPVLGLQGAVEVIALAVVQLVFDVGLVEVAERQLAGLVGDSQLRDVPPAADAAQNRL